MSTAKKKPTSGIPFDWQVRTRLVYGAGSIESVGHLAREIGVRNALVVTDAGVAAAGHAARVRAAFEASGMPVAVFEGVNENPSSSDAEACAEVARKIGADAFVGVGGGSSLDTAKAASFLVTNGGAMPQYRGYGKAKNPLLPNIAIPTTAGTGSECQSYALISDDETRVKMACGDPTAAPAIAVLDPELSRSMPRRVTALTGVDAISHAVESAVTRTRHAVSSMLAREAFRRLAPAVPRTFESPDDLRVRGDALLGSAFAGSAIELSMLGAAHASANPLTAVHDVAHGQAVGVMLPGVVRMNAADPAIEAIYEDLVMGAKLDSIPVAGRTRDAGADGAVGAGERLARYLEDLLVAAGLATSLEDLGVPRDDVARLARDASEQWTGGHNPRPMSVADFEALYASTWPRKERLAS